MNHTAEQIRILAVSLSSRGFGYAVMEGNSTLILYGKKVFAEDKNVRSLAHIDKLIAHNQPDVLVIHDVNANGTHRAPRIKELHRKVVALAKQHHLKVVKISGTELRSKLLGNPRGTKQAMAELLAKQFPDELTSRLPPKRQPWKSEDARMDIFAAMALVVTIQLKPAKQILPNG